MLRWMSGSEARRREPEAYRSVAEGLSSLYEDHLAPLERHYKFNEFHSAPLSRSDFLAKPVVLLVGQYSVGKTSFIKYLLGSDFPGMRIGPEPTTDAFVAITHGETEGIVPGNALVVDRERPFRELGKFGNGFLTRFYCSHMPNKVLESVSFIDTPGILSGEKQRVERGYDFSTVLRWFAERADRIILLFDAHKLDISDEFKRSIEELTGQDEKIRIVLNKADQIDQQQLMRVYGALMWSLGKVLSTRPEVARVYIGSFWEEAMRHDENRSLFERETLDLFNDIQSLPKKAALRQLSDFIKRARLVKVHALIIGELKARMPNVFRKARTKQRLIDGLDDIYVKLQREHCIAESDFPRLKCMQELLAAQDFTRLHAIKPTLIRRIDRMIAEDFTQLMRLIPSEELDKSEILGGVFAFGQSPFVNNDFGRMAAVGESEWLFDREVQKRDQYAAEFARLDLSPDGKLSGQAAKCHLLKSRLPSVVLARIWTLADVDRDGQLDRDEFLIAQHLVEAKLRGEDVPNTLPQWLVPPGKRVDDDVVDSFLSD